MSNTGIFAPVYMALMAALWTTTQAQCRLVSDDLVRDCTTSTTEWTGSHVSIDLSHLPTYKDIKIVAFELSLRGTFKGPGRRVDITAYKVNSHDATIDVRGDDGYPDYNNRAADGASGRDFHIGDDPNNPPTGGYPGASGRNGGNGRNGGTVQFAVGVVSGLLNLIASGGHGGQSQGGGYGGDGGTFVSVDKAWARVICNHGNVMTWVMNGGNGGNGGRMGRPGNGGSGGIISITAINSTSLATVSTSTQGGTKGYFGGQGYGGSGGRPEGVWCREGGDGQWLLHYGAHGASGWQCSHSREWWWCSLCFSSDCPWNGASGRNSRIFSHMSLMLEFRQYEALMLMTLASARRRYMTGSRDSAREMFDFVCQVARASTLLNDSSSIVVGLLAECSALLIQMNQGNDYWGRRANEVPNVATHVLTTHIEEILPLLKTEETVFNAFKNEARVSQTIEAQIRKIQTRITEKKTAIANSANKLEEDGRIIADMSSVVELNKKDALGSSAVCQNAIKAMKVFDATLDTVLSIMSTFASAASAPTDPGLVAASVKGAGEIAKNLITLARTVFSPTRINREVGWDFGLDRRLQHVFETNIQDVSGEFLDDSDKSLALLLKEAADQRRDIKTKNKAASVKFYVNAAKVEERIREYLYIWPCKDFIAVFRSYGENVRTLNDMLVQRDLLLTTTVKDVGVVYILSYQKKQAEMKLANRQGLSLPYQHTFLTEGYAMILEGVVHDVRQLVLAQNYQFMTEQSWQLLDVSYHGINNLFLQLKRDEVLQREDQANRRDFFNSEFLSSDSGTRKTHFWLRRRDLAGDFARFDSSGELNFVVPNDLVAFEQFSSVRILGMRVYFPDIELGETTNVKLIKGTLRQHGSTTGYRPDGVKMSFLHDEKHWSFAYDTETKEAEKLQFFENISEEARKFTGFPPFGAWMLQVDDDWNKGLDTTIIQTIEFEFFGTYLPPTCGVDCPPRGYHYPTTVSPTMIPTVLPSGVPSNVPSTLPSSLPTTLPTLAPTTAPSDAPSSLPSDLPSSLPSTLPTLAPTTAPTDTPSSLPSNLPTLGPTIVPTDAPSSQPSNLPSTSPTLAPTTVPSDAPSSPPSSPPSSSPTIAPTTSPTQLEDLSTIAQTTNTSTNGKIIRTAILGVLALAVVCLCGVIGIWLYRRHKHARVIEDEIAPVQMKVEKAPLKTQESDANQPAIVAEL